MPTLAESAVEAAEDNSAPQRCQRAIKMGLRLLAALRPLHARRLVHAALAPKHVAKVRKWGSGKLVAVSSSGAQACGRGEPQ